MLSWTVRVISRHESRADPAQICETWTSADMDSWRTCNILTLDRPAPRKFGSRCDQLITVTCCRYKLWLHCRCHKLGSALRLFGASARLNSSWKDGALDVAGAEHFSCLLMSFSYFCLRFVLDFWELLWSRNFWHQFSFALRCFPFLGSFGIFGAVFEHLCPICVTLQVSYLPGHGLWRKPWYCAALSKFESFDQDKINKFNHFQYLSVSSIVNEVDELDHLNLTLVVSISRIIGGDHHWSYPSEAKGAGMKQRKCSEEWIYGYNLIHLFSQREREREKESCAVAVARKESETPSPHASTCINMHQHASTCINMHQLIGYISFLFRIFGTFGTSQRCTEQWTGRAGRAKCRLKMPTKSIRTGVTGLVYSVQPWLCRAKGFWCKLEDKIEFLLSVPLFQRLPQARANKQFEQSFSGRG